MVTNRELGITKIFKDILKYLINWSIRVLLCYNLTTGYKGIKKDLECGQREVSHNRYALGGHFLSELPWLFPV